MKAAQKIIASTLRRQGLSIQEIAAKLDVSKSTVSLWARDVPLSKAAQRRLVDRSRRGRQKGLLANQERRKLRDKRIFQQAKGIIGTIPQSKEQSALVCALLYWCEGGKTEGSIQFANADPLLVKTFLHCLRLAFELDEKKFRVCLHLHEYHDVEKQMIFWSQATGIHRTQFLKSYRKPHTGKRKKSDYPGCASIRYHDVTVALTLRSLWYIFGTQIDGGVV